MSNCSVAFVSARPAGYKMPSSSSHTQYSSISRSYGSYDNWRNYGSSSERPFISHTSSYITDYKPSYSSVSRKSSVPLSTQGGLLPHSLGSKFLYSPTRERYDKNDFSNLNSTYKVLKQTKDNLEPTLNAYTKYRGSRDTNLMNSTSLGDIAKYSPKSHKYRMNTLPLTANVGRSSLSCVSSSLSELERSPSRRISGAFLSSQNYLSQADSLPDNYDKLSVYRMGKSTSQMGSEGKLLAPASVDAHSNVRVTSPFKEHSITEKIAGSSSKSKKMEMGLVGIQNIGNTCFLNAVLQCLSNTKPLLNCILTDEFLSDINYSSSMKGALIKAFNEIIHDLWQLENPGKSVNPTAFKNQIQRFAPRFMGNNQQDAQEFLRYLLEGLHEDINRVRVKSRCLRLDVDQKMSSNDKAVEAWKSYLRNDSSKIVDLFVGQLKSTLSCTKCGNRSITFDPFWDLSLPIPEKRGACNIKECLDLFTKEEILCGEERPECSVCKERQKSTKSFSIQKFPKILVLHLKRFSAYQEYGRRGKLNLKVDFPIKDFNLGLYAANDGLNCSYDLYGVVYHSGTTRCGHYIASCKHPYSEKWHEYNDTRVTPISAHSIVTSDAYMLFYEMNQNM